jgi:hypothetical protein
MNAQVNERIHHLKDKIRNVKMSGSLKDRIGLLTNM